MTFDVLSVFMLRAFMSNTNYCILYSVFCTWSNQRAQTVRPSGQA